MLDQIVHNGHDVDKSHIPHCVDPFDLLDHQLRVCPYLEMLHLVERTKNESHDQASVLSHVVGREADVDLRGAQIFKFLLMRCLAMPFLYNLILVAAGELSRVTQISNVVITICIAV